MALLKVLAWDDATPQRARTTTIGLPDTAYTQGSLIFVGATNNFTEANGSLFYDEGNSRLVVGGTPVDYDVGQSMHVTGRFTRSNTAAGDLSDLVQEDYYANLTLTGSTTDGELAEFTLTKTEVRGVKIDYTIRESGTADVRTGTIFIANGITDIGISDQHAETNDLGLTWTAIHDGPNLKIKYTTSHADDCSMHADVKVFRKVAPLFMSLIGEGEEQVIPADGEEQVPFDP